MRKAQKQEILEALDSLGQAHEEIREELHKISNRTAPDGQRILSMLSECQEFAVSLGETIEKLEGEEHVTVQNISKYCEAVYEVYTIVCGQNSEINENKLYKFLSKHLIKIENSVKNEILPRSEIIFLPYKASMWDSMESVWMTARDDENCDAYVIPIPYYERKRDRSLGEMHYEGDEYPDYVPITDWQAYSIEERRPDVIYIQNPYDEWNLVTCVHPKFFSKELKKYTDMLVYLPYFVGINNRVGEHFCTTPGVMYADRVIVESEKVKKSYIDSIRKFEQESNCKGIFGDLDQKILPLGSPKLDRIRRMVESGVAEIPEEWESRLYKADGKRKKIIFYNTTVDALLKHSETYMEKLKSVLSLFRQEEEIALLWRPHPLLETTIKSMRDDLYRQYREIVEAYQEEGWGIYDESADIDRAIVLSDAYYGDMSSVVELYRQTGKPILIESYFLGENKGLMFEAYVQVDEFTAYASCAMFNGLFKIDVYTNRCTYIGMFPNERVNGKRMHAKAVYTDGKIYFAPASAENISIYDVAAGEFETVSIHDYKGEYRFFRSAFKFADAVKYDDFIFFIGSTYPAVLRMSCQTGMLDYYTDWVPREGFVFRKGTLIKDSVFYIPNSIGNAVLEFHMDNCKGILHHIGINNHGSWSICRAGNDYWLIPRREGFLVRWNPVDNTVTEYNDYPDGFEGHNFLFSRGYYCGGYIRAVPAYANMSVKISPDTGEITENDFVKVEEGEAVGFLFASGSYYYLFKQRKTEASSAVKYVAYYKLNTLDNTWEECSFEFGEGREEFAADYYRRMIRQKAGEVICKEDLFFDMEDFLRNVIAENGSGDGLPDGICRKEEIPVGRTIHERISTLILV